MISKDLRDAIKDVELLPDPIVSLVDRIARHWSNGERSIADDVEMVVRLLDRQEEFEEVLPGISGVIEALAREAGLFSYIGRDLSWRDKLAEEAYRVPGLEAFTFHREQRAIFTKLYAGQNMVLSAPTSFGKTLLVDALIAAKQPNTIVIVVPTIALLEERRRTLSDRFPNYILVTQGFQEITTSPTIVIGTQERILEREETIETDLFVVDEFYKLDLTSSNSRAKALNALFARYIDVSKQVYLLGPSIETNPVNQTARPDFEFVKTAYSPVTADIVEVEPQGADPEVLAGVLRTLRGQSSLVYCQSPKSVRVVARELLRREVGDKSEELYRIACWLRENYHRDWYLADAIEGGIGIHHGRVPRAIAQLMIQLFNKGKISILLCTSSLIEGVNTAAQNVLIYDRNISTRKLDRFTFDNIKGRAGRMFQHFVGKVYLFNPAPETQYETLEIPLLQDRDRISNDQLIQIDSEYLSEASRKRKEILLRFLEVPEDILKRHSKFGIAEIENLFQELADLIDSGDRKLLWSGYGRYPEARDAMEAVWGRLEFDKHQVRSAKQFAHFANRLRKRNSMKDFLHEIVRDDHADDDLDLAFNFLKGAEFSFSKPLQLLEELIRALGKEDVTADYSKYIADLVSWSMPNHLKCLEELGVPTPVVENIKDYIDQYDPDAAIADVKRLMSSKEHLSGDDVLVLSYTVAN